MIVNYITVDKKTSTLYATGLGGGGGQEVVEDEFRLRNEVPGL